MIKTKIIYQFFICLFFILFSGCQKEQDMNLLYNKWEFEYFTKKGLHISSKEYIPDELSKMTIIFSEDGNLLWKGQTNTGPGSFEASKNGNLKILSLGTTYVGGTEEQLYWELRYYGALKKSKEFKIKDKNLKIYYNNDDETDMMVFKKQ